MLRFLKAISSKFNSQLKSNPLRTNLVFGSALTIASDYFTQHHLQKKDGHDFIRTARMLLFNAVLWTPISYYKYILLDKIWPVVSLKFVSLKVGLDQFLLAPILINIYLFFNEILQGKGFEGYKKRFEQEYWNTVTNCWKLWIPVQILNFFIIPLAWRVVYVRTVGFFWAIIVNYLSHR